MRKIFSSDGLVLVFPDDDIYEEYKKELELLEVKTYKSIRNKYGVWAGNQNKFVKDRDDLNDWDSKCMEDLHDKYYDDV